MLTSGAHRRAPSAILFTALLAACLPRAPASPGVGRPSPPAPASPSPSTRAFISIDTSPIALTHVRVIDGTGAPPAEDQTIVIADTRIVAVGRAGLVTIPPEAKVVDLREHTVLPGLVGMHDHLFYPASGELFQEMATSFPRLYLAAGVTTIRTTGSVEPYTDLEVKRRIDAGRVPGPKMHVSGPYLEGPGAYTPQMHELRDPADATRTVDFWADAGATSFKAYMHLTRAELTASIAAAHARGLKVTGHLCSIGFREAAALGIDNLEHGLLTDTEHYSKKVADECPSVTDARLELTQLAIASPAIQLTIRELVARHVAVTSTLAVYEGYVPDRPPLRDRVMSALIAEAQEIGRASCRERV